jgi:glycosyltransferase involved in cell wall biosynthesis
MSKNMINIGKTTPISSKIKVLVVPSDRTGVGYYRSTKPHITLEELYPDEFHVDIEYEPQIENDEWLKKYDLVHFHRTIGAYEKMGDIKDENGNIIEGTMSRLKRLGIPTIMDLDDYWAPGSHHPAYLLIKESGVAQKIVNNLKLADYVCTTTDIFAKEIQKHNKNTFVLPNGIDPRERQFTPKVEKSDRLRIGWLGGSSHLQDLEILNGVVGRLKSDGLLDKVQFVLCGFDLRGFITMIDEKTGQRTQRKIEPMESVWYRYEQIFTDNHSIVSPEYAEHLLSFTKDEFHNVANEPYRRVWTKPISTYASNYNLFDVSLAPLSEHLFNQVKSQLKVIEAGFHKKALIAQDYGPYQIDIVNAYEKGGTINPEGNGLLIPSVKNHKQWYQHIKRLINNPELVNQLSNNLFESVKDIYSIQAITEKRRDWYKSLVKK